MRAWTITLPIVSVSMTTSNVYFASQRPAQLLLALDRFEQRFEVPFAEAARAVPLDDLEEQRGAVLDRLGEDLQEVTFIVAVHEDAQLAELAEILVDLADARRQHVVVRLRHAEEGDIVGAQVAHRLD